MLSREGRPPKTPDSIPSTLVVLAGRVPPHLGFGRDLMELPTARLLHGCVGDQENPGDRGAFVTWDGERKLYSKDAMGAKDPEGFELASNQSDE